MLGHSKYKTRKVLQRREDKIIENSKKAMFIKGPQTSDILNRVMVDLCSLKQPDVVNYSQKNDFRPFEDVSGIEFLSNKSDCSLFVFGSHTKKRPHHITIGRTFSNRIFDMIEFGVQNFKSMSSFSAEKPSVGNHPLLIFSGEEFDQKEEFKKFANIMLDFFRGSIENDAVNLTGIEHTLVFTSTPDKIYMRGYNLKFQKSGSKTPYTELNELGPSMDITLGRHVFASQDLMKIATRIPKEIMEVKTKNLRKDAFTDSGKIHMPRQDIREMVTRKQKGFKKRKNAEEEEQAQKIARIEADEAEE